MFMSRINNLRPRTLALLVFASSSAAACGLVALGDRLARVERRQAAESLARAVAANIDHELASVQVPPAVLGTLVSQLGRPPADLEQVAGELLRYSASVDSVQLAPGGVIGFIKPLPGNEAAIGLDLLRDPLHRQAIEQARSLRRVVLAGPFLLRQGGMALAARSAIYTDVAGEEQFWGVASAIIRLPRLLAQSGLGRLEAAGYRHQLSRSDGDGRSETFAGAEAPLHDPVRVELAAPTGWTLAVAPRGGWGPSWITWMALAASLLTSGVLTLLALRLFQEPDRLRTEVAARTEELEAAHRAQRQIEASAGHAQKLEAIGLLAGGVAHDFNNLLVGIVGYSDVLGRAAEPGSLAGEAAQVIGQAARRAADLTRQLLAFARKGKQRAERVDVHALAGEVGALLARTIGKDVVVATRLDAPRPVVVGDPGQLHQVVLNLGVNARDAMPRGGTLAIETRNEALDEARARPMALPPGPYLVVAVRDTGVGIPAALRERIFEPFFTTKEEEKGTGMGLAMVYGIARSHGGAIQVQSEEGRGSTFEVWLPEATASASAVAASAPSPTPGLVAAVQARAALVLVVDDEDTVRRTAARLLRTLGLRTAVATGGQEAIEWLEAHRGEASAVLLDFGMPGMDGLTCLRRLRALERDLPVLVSSGYAEGGQIQAMIDEGGAVLLPKPYSRDELARAIFTAVASRR